MKKSIRMLIAGITFAVLSTPFYAFGGASDVSDLKEILPKIVTTHEISYKQFEGKVYDYKVDISTSSDFEIEVYSKKTPKVYKFIDNGSDGTLDIYVGSTGYEFTAEDMSSEKWKELEDDYHRSVRNILPLAKKILKEKRSTSLDKDLKDLESLWQDEAGNNS